MIKTRQGFSTTQIVQEKELLLTLDFLCNKTDVTEWMSSPSQFNINTKNNPSDAYEAVSLLLKKRLIKPIFSGFKA